MEPQKPNDQPFILVDSQYLKPEGPLELTQLEDDQVLCVAQEIHGNSYTFQLRSAGQLKQNWPPRGFMVFDEMPSVSSKDWYAIAGPTGQFIVAQPTSRALPTEPAAATSYRVRRR